MSQPVLTLLAGSNGSGKSTLTSAAREEFQLAPILDPDAISKSIRDTLPHANSDIEAGRRALLRAEELIQSHQSFTAETTLSGSSYLRLTERAKKAGFFIVAILIGTSSVEINMERIRMRVAKGGHDVPEQDQRRRYPRTLANMKRLLPLADLAVILDNSNPQGYTLVAAGHQGALQWFDPVPAWAAGLRNL